MVIYYAETPTHFILTHNKKSTHGKMPFKKAHCDFSPMRKSMVFEDNHSQVHKASKRFYKTIEELLS